MTAPDPFETVMSDLVKAIGEVERLPWPTKDQYTRLQNQAVRLMTAAQNIRYSREGLAKIQEEEAA